MSVTAKGCQGHTVESFLEVSHAWALENLYQHLCWPRSSPDDEHLCISVGHPSSSKCSCHCSFFRKGLKHQQPQDLLHNAQAQGQGER